MIRRRRALPRAVRVALSLSRGTIGMLLFALFVMLAGAFAAGLVVGLRAHDPMIVEKIVEKDVPRPLADSSPTENVVAVAPREPKTDVAPAVLPTKPKLDVTIGPPDDSTAWAVQIGAYPDLTSAQQSLDAHVAALAVHPIYIVPAEIKGKGIWHRVRLGTFKTRAEAERVRGALPDDLAKQAIVVNYK